MANGDIVVISGSASKNLTNKICKNMNELNQIRADFKSHSDKETFVEIMDNVRGRDVYIVQSTCCPANDHFMELFLLIDAAKRSTARRITAVIPYFGYARQDRKDRPRVPISARLMANLIDRSGADRVIGMDFHTGQIQGFFDIPVDHLYARPVFVDYIKKNFSEQYLKNSVALAPDIGSAKQTRKYSNYLGLGLAIIDKRRSQPGISEVMNIVGDVEGKNIWIFDDLIDTGGTICNAAKTVMEKGALEVNAVATHGVLSSPYAKNNFRKSQIKRILITDTIFNTWYQDQDEELDRLLTIVSVADMFKTVILKSNSNDSISCLFE